MILDKFDHPKNNKKPFGFSRKSKRKFTCSKKAMCLDETTACCTTRFVNGENTFGHIQPFVVI